ncbi:glycine cleavage system protein R [Parerythrobacter aestuarii]|uniref:glycine cleavage system protein R n=1 Tax=Parerythrobacter aestuarii TaxID=3020909 RepID=UPI0024DECCEA|nr:ACT domain-containing protein [Parerythrobacter aestuarii]
MTEITRIVLSVTGSDKPGLTEALSAAIFAAGGNWQEGHLSRLGGLYVGSVLVEIDPLRVAELEQEVRGIDAHGLTVSALPAGESPAASGRALMFELIGQDRPGIIREVTRILTGLGANIESLSSGEETGAHAGERLFRAHVSVSLPDAVRPEGAQEALEAISSEIMVDFTFA